MLLELLHRVAAHAGANGMDAGALGEVLAPCIAWQPPPPKKVRCTLHPKTAVINLSCMAVELEGLLGTSSLRRLPAPYPWFQW